MKKVRITGGTGFLGSHLCDRYLKEGYDVICLDNLTTGNTKNMPTYLVERSMHVLNTHKKPMNVSKILVIGLAHKQDVDDMRESPTFKIFDLLTAKGAEFDYYDPFIPEIWEIRNRAEYTGKKTVEWNKETVSSYDAVIISTNHSNIDYTELAEWSNCVVDTRNAMQGIEEKNESHIFKA